jgi:hypothetical protein
MKSEKSSLSVNRKHRALNSPDAIAKAKELSDLGKQDVTILAPDGKAYQSGEFHLLLKGAEENDYPPEGAN